MRHALSILAIEPYMAGSHRAFLEGLQDNSRHRIDIWGLPGRKWKWRMRASAINFARKLEALHEPPDLFLASDYLDVAAFRALMPARFREVPLLTYFHENQLTYPVKDESERDYQYVFTNITTCLASDRILFNSEFHREDFLSALEGFFRRMPDHVPAGVEPAIRARSGVQHLGISTLAPQRKGPREAGGAPKALTVIWNHRWEYDKNPELFFETLFELDAAGVDFKLIVLGENFRDSPPIFEEARHRLADHVTHFGFTHDREEYSRLLREADVVVSTSIHEFFGLAVVEGIAAGGFPLLPHRLAYPELLPPSLHAECLYRSPEEFKQRLRHLLSAPMPTAETRLRSMGEEFQWNRKIIEFDTEFASLAAPRRSG